MSDLYLYNSLTKKKELFVPIKSDSVSMYTCGFTVYDHTHIGHIKKYVGDDLVKRALQFNGYKVNHVQNVTDVGHLVSDSDEGEDKMEKGARKYNLTVEEISRKYEKEFYSTMDKMNVIRPNIVERAASDKSIAEQISNIEKLVANEYAYVTELGVYFNVAKLPNYNPFSNQNLEDKLQGSREGLITHPNKKNNADFAIWVFRKGDHANHTMHWDSPWGDGFPGWHIECSTISMANLGERIDIHTGGIDHLEIHHPNEIAQNYGICGHDVVQYWMHHNFLTVDGKKMSKSLNNFYTLEDVISKGFDPMVFRYHMLGTHYRQQLNFTWESLAGADNAYNILIDNLFLEKGRMDENGEINIDYSDKFLEAINNDFNTPQALAVMWELLRDKKVSGADRFVTVMKFDEVFGLNLKSKVENLSKSVNIALPEEIKVLVESREKARKDGDWKKSDTLRDEITSKGYLVNDTSGGQVVVRIS
ncbi:MAG: cysteinyl-tRNA synthetase [Patescibacteria group bacterium]|nr:cysteinyl-tRNA synthetase [Patescibacteria group bacterium]